ncbi:MAG: polysaccharide pyruvyl transferase family protein [bacterium]
MDDSVKKICVIGNFSGRNAGDAAILGSLLEDITKQYRNLLFLIPTVNPKFVYKHYSNYPIKPIPLMPWNLSLKILGLPIFNSVLCSDLVLVTDAILFDLNLFNPLFNYLSTMALVLPLAKKRGIPVVLYNVSLGPISSKAGKICLRRVIDSSEIIIVRDTESIAILKNTQIIRPDIKVGSDCALNVTPANSNKLDAIIRKESLQFNGQGTITFNVNSYIDVFVRGNKRAIGIENFSNLISASIDKIVEELKVNILFVITQPMDFKITKKVILKIKNRDRIRLVTNVNYNYQELAGLFSRADIHVGMRTHSLILASSVNTPIVGIIATPKNRGYMQSIKQDQRMVEFKDLTVERLVDVVKSTWVQREHIRKSLKRIIETEKAKARNSALLLTPYLN